MRNRRYVWVGLLWLLLSGVTLGYELLHQPPIIVQWTTETEMNTAGFNLYRATSEDGPFEQINPSLILGAGDPLVGADYEYVDSGVQPHQTYYYQLEEVEVNGQANRVDLVGVEARGPQIWVLVVAGLGILAGLYFLLGGLARPESDRAADSRPPGDGFE